MLVEHDRWADNDDDDDGAADNPEHSMDERSNGPVDRSYAGSGDIMQSDVDVESEWALLSANLIQNYMHSFRENQIIWCDSVVRSKQTPQNIISASALREHAKSVKEY